MRNRTDLLNLIAAKIKAKTYLEIGIYNPDHNFNQVAVQNKIGVDPDPKAGADIKLTSDTFFKYFPDGHFDLVLIDGLHHKDQAKRDLENCWATLNPGGAIVMHDCNPPTEATTCVPRGNQREWCGDVYKLATAIKSDYKFTVDFDYGCLVIRKPEVPHFDLLFEDEPKDWADFDAHREEYLQLVTPERAQQIIELW